MNKRLQSKFYRRNSMFVEIHYVIFINFPVKYTY